MINKDDINRKVSNVFKSLNPKYVTHKVVQMPENWKDDEPVFFTFIIFNESLSPREIREIFMLSNELNLPNPRPFEKKLIEYASVLHPRFYKAIVRDGLKMETENEKQKDFFHQLNSGHFTSPELLNLKTSLPQYYLQSLLFLAGCTLSSAILLDRYTKGTIDSKLNRLWQFSLHAQRFNYKGIDVEELQNFIKTFDDNSSLNTMQKIIRLKKMYSKVLSYFANKAKPELKLIEQKKLNKEEKERFGFIEYLQSELGDNLDCVFVYGSSVTSENFGDYDLILLVKDEEKAFKALKGKELSYKGFDLNIGIYDYDDFLVFQTLSGDNLDQNVICLYGSAKVPVKTREQLILRNFSFGFIRMRQLLGMAGFLVKEGVHFDLKGKDNLYQYFIKIPMHIMKGVRSVTNELISKEWINKWTFTNLNYDIDEQVKICKEHDPWEAIANAYTATLKMVDFLNSQYKLIEFKPLKEKAVLQKTPSKSIKK